MSHEVYAVSAQSIETYKPIYFIAGDKENQVKYQVSFKYNLWEKSGLYLSYTQLSKWDLYDQSSPFRETNYNPSIFWEKENLWKLDLLRISPYSHLSNGRDGQESRGTDRGFVESQISYGDIINIGIREKAGWFYSVSNKNHDIKRYIGYFETEGFMQIKDIHGYIGHEKIYIKGEWTHKYYWMEIGLSLRLFTSQIQPNLYLQYYRGYGEFLINYNEKTEALRAGFILNI
jgi:outer membrane phospholipase A